MKPRPEGGLLAQLRRAGQIENATADLDDLAPPLPSRSDATPSAVLARLRRDER